MTSEQLADLLESVTQEIKSGDVPGAVLAVSSGSDQWLTAVGSEAPGGAELRTDAVFRISSMTKPLTAALTLKLAEEGVLALSDPVDRWIPELADRRVLRTLDGPLDDTVPAEQSATVEDLLLMRLGFGFAFEVEKCPVAERAIGDGLGMGPPLPSAIQHSPDEWIRRFAELPLMEQPGKHWRYELAYAVLGVLLARATSTPLPQLLSARVLKPLGMNDTGFTVPEQARDRLIPSYVGTEDGIALFDPVDGSDWLNPPVFPHAGGGLVSTATDYLRFARSLLDDGGLINAASRAAMTRDHLTAEQRNGPSAGIFLDGEGWGYGVQVRDQPGLPARYGWGGGLGTTWYSYPEHGVSAVLMTQHLPPSLPVLTAFTNSLDTALGG
ncbi:serine hydrolase domain-containing protein [Kribbella sp. NPDC056861]|uniref:serine hydrolase domain-containing protein n=1 Tax=Kribbella sp. NPDC056861 TaxID=3154857 RepID=UPI00344370AE